MKTKQLQAWFMHKKKLTLVFLFGAILFCASTQFTHAQSLGSWTVVNVKYSFSNKWSVFGEAQIRSQKLYNQFNYYEYKGGVNYTFKKNITATLGTGSYQTYRDSGNFKLPKINNEWRVWPQLVIAHNLGMFQLEHRFRAEFRFTSIGYANRYRYKIGVLYPISKGKKNFTPLKLGASNEIFVTNRSPYFIRDRVNLLLYYKPSVAATIQLGYQRQIDYNSNVNIGKDYIFLGLALELKK
ncbi:MAG: DUF2490 domain-containing protein [Bacteroidetes bacterium]|nr:DUF2490 domain-containing protein [Bacteroidota bacterium]MBS1756338.1 DUF2490 domain-containing protein [Bacteroidota bacterium]